MKGTRATHAARSSRVLSLTPSSPQHAISRGSGSRRLSVTQAASQPTLAGSTPTTTEAPPRTLLALKEWAVAIAALGSGDQTVLFRKGGIREPCFKPSAREFLLFPTAFHSEHQLLKEGVAERYEEAFALDPRANPTLPLTVHATITGAWTTFDLRVLQILDPLHVHSEAFRETRLKWRGAQPITILELRALRLEPQLVLHLREEHFGCFSWVDLASDLSLPLALESATSALDDAAFSQRQHILRELLLQVEVTELHF
ncbi:MAG: hypothetical protein WDW36_003574 [Sanguina aurantia]